MRWLGWITIGGLVGWIARSKPKAKRWIKEPLSLRSRYVSAEITLTVATASFDIWDFYNSPKTRDLKALNEFPTFFRYDEEAHFRNLITSLFSLYDKTDGTNTIKGLIHSLDPADAKPIWRKYMAVHCTVKKIEILRHNVVAHRNASERYDAVYSRAELTPDDLRTLLADSLTLLAMIAAVIGEREPTMSPFLTPETAGLLHRIKQRPLSKPKPPEPKEPWRYD